MRKPKLTVVLAGAAALIVAIQLVPYGHDHSNPPVVAEPQWDSPDTRALAVRACFACHSNQTEWPWYSYVAPASWLVAYDVEEGREYLNFSEWNRPQEEAGESAETVAEGEMPPAVFVPLHPEARLTPAERDALIAGLTATLGSEAPGGAAPAGRDRDVD